MSMIRSSRLSVGRSAALKDQPEVWTGRAFTGPIFVCPQGKTAIIREALLTSPTGTSSTGTSLLWVQPYGSGTNYLLWAVPPSAAYATTQLVCDAVLETGDQLIMATDLADINWYISGAVLTGESWTGSSRY